MSGYKIVGHSMEAAWVIIKWEEEGRDMEEIEVSPYFQTQIMMLRSLWGIDKHQFS